MGAGALDQTSYSLLEKAFARKREFPAGIADHSEQVKTDYIFLAYPGEKSDGRDFIPKAISAGALVVVWEPEGFDWQEEWCIENVPIQDLRYKAGFVVNQFYKNPSEKMWVVGITGTNGKTSCATWIASCLNELNHPTANVGTMGCFFKSKKLESENTTPGPVMLNKTLDCFLKNGATGVALEVSSHALSQGRVTGVSFDTALFTNLSRDHLDYHKTMDQYAREKRRLFFWETLKTVVINSDDKFGVDLIKQLKASNVKIISYGRKTGDIRCGKMICSRLGMELHLNTPWGRTTIRTNIIGDHNVYNILGVFGVLMSKGLTIDSVSEALSLCRPVNGRMQAIRFPGAPLVVVDYAHTPDAMEQSLQSLAQLLRPEDRLHCVFGCGGDRDAGKRAEMGRVATSLAHLCFITDDNPRFENSMSIIEDIVEGADSNFVVEQDRANAINRSISEAKPNDIVLIAGKGHESYQDIKNNKLPFSDEEVAEEILLKRTRGILNV